MSDAPTRTRLWPGTLPAILLSLAGGMAAAGMLLLLGLAGRVETNTVFVPPPADRGGDREPVYLECRGDRIYPLDMPGLLRAAEERVSAISKQLSGDRRRIQEALSGPEARITNAFYTVDISGALAGQISIVPRVDTAPGYAIDDREGLDGDGFLPRLLRDLGSARRLKLIARDDSFRAFKYAQRLAFLSRVDTSVDVYSADEPIVYSALLRD